MRSRLCSLALIALSGPVCAQQTGEISFSGLVDGYYSLNFNHPASRINQLRNFDVQANQFSLNMAKLTLERAPDPLGFRMDLGFGRAFEIVHGAEIAPSEADCTPAGHRFRRGRSHPIVYDYEGRG